MTTDKGWNVTLDDTATYNFGTGDPLTGHTLWTSEVDSVTANGTASAVDLTLGVDPDDAVGPHSFTGLTNPLTVTSGTYHYGDIYSFSQTIESVKATGTHTGEVKLTLEDNNNPPTGITEVTVPNPTTFSYQVGGTYTGHLKISKISNIQDKATVKAKNGQSATGAHFSGLAVNSSTTPAVCKGIAEDGNVKVVHRTSEKSFNGKPVSSVTIATEDGQSISGMVGQSYAQGAQFCSPLVTLFTIYDTQGREHKVTLKLTKKPSEDNTWSLSLGNGTNTDTVEESDGSMNLSLSGTDLVFDEMGAYKSGGGTITVTYTNPNGAQDSRQIDLNFGALTQYAGTSTIKGEADGNAAGTLKSVQVDASGTITGTYTNGIMRKLAQVAVAQFYNASGLTKTGGNLYQVSNNSGKANVHTAADVGATITASALEMSNVDIANEFSDMIITQRGFQSNSKIITVDDEMLETVIGMKR